MAILAHGMSNTSLHSIWRGMFGRCYNPNNKIYKYYGGRGIKICKRWHSFENFYKDMGNRPEGLTIERMNNDGNYEPNNCKWVSRKVQRNNQRPRSCGRCKQRWFRAWHKDSMAQYLNNSQSEFARQQKLIQSHISECLLGKAKYHRGWFFVLQEVPL